jgi:hypothetical protein
MATFPEQPGHCSLLHDELDATTKKRGTSLRWREWVHSVLSSAKCAAWVARRGDMIAPAVVGCKRLTDGTLPG